MEFDGYQDGEDSLIVMIPSSTLASEFSFIMLVLSGALALGVAALKLPLIFLTLLAAPLALALLALRRWNDGYLIDRAVQLAEAIRLLGDPDSLPKRGVYVPNQSGDEGYISLF